MSEIELHGWTTTQVPTQAIFDLDSHEFRVFAYLIFRARGKEHATPGVERIAQELDLSERTTKRALSGCRKKHYIRRERRLGTSSVTHVFTEPTLCLAWDEARRATDGPTEGTLVAQQTGQEWPGKENTEKENTEKDSGGEVKDASAGVTHKELVGFIARNIFHPSGEDIPRQTYQRAAVLSRAVRAYDDGVTPEKLHKFCVWWQRSKPNTDFPLGEHTFMTHYAKFVANGRLEERIIEPLAELGNDLNIKE